MQKDYDYPITGLNYNKQYQSLPKMYIHTYIFNQATTHGSSEYLAYSATHTPIYQRPSILQHQEIQNVRSVSQ